MDRQPIRWRLPQVDGPDLILVLASVRRYKRKRCERSQLPYLTNRCFKRDERTGTLLNAKEVQFVIVGCDICVTYGRDRSTPKVALPWVMVGEPRLSKRGGVTGWSGRSGLLAMAGVAEVETVARRRALGEQVPLPLRLTS